NADRLRPLASAASRARRANSGSNESDTFSTATLLSYHSRIGCLTLLRRRTFSAAHGDAPHMSSASARSGSGGASSTGGQTGRRTPPPDHLSPRPPPEAPARTRGG